MPGFGRASFSPQSNVRLNFIQIILYFFYKINFAIIFDIFYYYEYIAY